LIEPEPKGKPPHHGLKTVVFRRSRILKAIYPHSKGTKFSGVGVKPNNYILLNPSGFGGKVEVISFNIK
jgi:hypothetical protein